VFNRLRLAVRILEGIVRRNHPSLLVFFVTSRCNARCAFCFNLANVVQPSKPPEIGLADVTHIARSMYPLPQLLLSGGEPFLRGDLADLVAAFYSHSGTRQISIPTNGSLPNQIVAMVEQIVRRCPKAFVNINLSLDAIGEEHDKARQIPGCYDRLCETVDRLTAIQYPEHDQAGRCRLGDGPERAHTW
jgi:molybdenum cofactor biosynthesis enzyme MoaA